MDSGEICAAIVIASLCISWIAIPFVFKKHWGDVAYYSYIGYAQMIGCVTKFLEQSLQSHLKHVDYDERDFIIEDRHSGMASVGSEKKYGGAPPSAETSDKPSSSRRSRGSITWLTNVTKMKRNSSSHRKVYSVDEDSFDSSDDQTERQREKRERSKQSQRPRRRRRQRPSPRAPSESSASSNSSPSSSSSSSSSSSEAEEVEEEKGESSQEEEQEELSASSSSSSSSDESSDEDEMEIRRHTAPNVHYMRRRRSTTSRNGIVFAARDYHINESDTSTSNTVLLVRRETTGRAEVLVSSYDDALGARAWHHYIPLEKVSVVFEDGQATAQIPIQTLHHENWDSTLTFCVVIDADLHLNCAEDIDPKKLVGRIRDSLDRRCATVHIVNTDDFPRQHKAYQKLFRKESHWLLRIFVFCRYVYDDLQIHIPDYFRHRFVVWYLIQFSFQGFFNSMLLPWIYLRLQHTTIPENRLSEAMLLAALGLGASCINQRIRYSFFGFWALGRFNSLRLVRFFHSIPFLHLQDPTLNGRFHKLFQNMESCMNNTWHAAMLTFRQIVNIVFIMIATTAFFQRDQPLTLIMIFFLIMASILLTRAIQKYRKWPDNHSFSDSERRETLISDEVDNLMNTRVIHATLAVTHRSTTRIDQGYAAYLHERNESWYYIDHNFWSKLWSWSLLVWVFVAMSPFLRHDYGVSVDFDVTLYLMVLQGTVLSRLDDALERFRYGLAQLDYLAETVGNEEYASYRTRTVEVSRERRRYWETELSEVPGKPAITAYRRGNAWNTLIIDRVSECDLPKVWREDGMEKIINCSAKIPLGSRLYGLPTDKFINTQLLWLLSGHVLPKSGQVSCPPDLQVTLVPNSLDCMPIAGTLLQNLRFGCGSEDVCGVDDETIWTLCRKLGMKEELINENPIVSQSSIRYSSVDMALAGLAQHLLTFPDLLLVNNLHCITKQSLDALHLYVNGGLLPDLSRGFSHNRHKNRKKSTFSPDKHRPSVSRTAIVLLPRREFLQHCDSEIVVGTSSAGTTIHVAMPHRDCGNRHKKRYSI